MSTLFFPPATLQKMTSSGLKESDIYDVFDHGEHGKTGDGSRLAFKKYHGYEVGIFYSPSNSKVVADYVVIAVWKKDRR